MMKEDLEMDTLQDDYMKYLMRYIIVEFNNFLKDDFNKYLNFRVILLIILSVLLFLVYLILWLPIISRLTKDFGRTRSMLGMIPIGLMIQVRNIRNYVKKVLHDFKGDKY